MGVAGRPNHPVSSNHNIKPGGIKNVKVFGSMQVTGKLIFQWQIRTNAFIRSDPKAVLAVFSDIADKISRKAVGIFFIMMQLQYLYPVVTVQAVTGADPDKTTTVLEDTVNIIAADTIINGEVFNISIACLYLCKYRRGVCKTVNKKAKEFFSHPIKIASKLQKLYSLNVGSGIIKPKQLRFFSISFGYFLSGRY